MPAIVPLKFMQAEQSMDRTKNDVLNIAIIEDIKEIAQELKDVLNADPRITCQKVYHDAESAVAFLSTFPVDVVLSDIGLPGMSGIEAIVRIRKAQPHTQFCMFTVFEDHHKIFNSLKAGAKGYILKNASADRIVSAMWELHQGGSPMTPEIARKVVDAFAMPQKSTVESLPLTSRERELLDLLCTGLLYKEIAQKLGITVGTVKQHIHKIYHKLEVNNKTEAINKYLNR